MTSVLIYSVVTQEVVLFAIAVLMCWRLKKGRPLSRDAFICGMATGIATLLWHWGAVGLPVLMILVFGPLKVYSKKVFWNILFGFLTPLWLSLPYYLYQVIMHYEFCIMK